MSFRRVTFGNVATTWMLLSVICLVLGGTSGKMLEWSPAFFGCMIISHLFFLFGGVYGHFQKQSSEIGVGDVKYPFPVINGSMILDWDEREIHTGDDGNGRRFYLVVERNTPET